MSELTFGGNYKDLSNDTEFQFEFSCDHCHKVWQSPEVPYDNKPEKSGTSNIAESAVGTGELTEEKVKDAAYETHQARALDRAIQQALRFFYQCRQCRQWFCGDCFDANYVMCVTCRPS